MAGGGQGASGAQGSSVPADGSMTGYKAAATPSIDPQQMQQLQAMMAAGRGIAQGAPNAQMYNTRPMPIAPAQGQASQIPGYAGGGFLDPGFMQYQGQGQPNQPDNVPVLTSQPPTVQNDGGPDAGASYAGNSMGFDGSGSDSGVGGQPVNQVQTPLQQQGTKPLGLAQFQQPQGLQIAGNPTSQVVQRPQLR